MSNTDIYAQCAFAYNLQPYAREFSNKNFKKGNIKYKIIRLSIY
jgi:hypothetical protein